MEMTDPSAYSYRRFFSGRKKELYTRVTLPDDIPGVLFLGPVPCQYESREEFETWLRKNEITLIVCLISNYEIQEKSPEYVYVIKNSENTWRHWQFPVEDFGVPSNRDDYYTFALFVALSVFYGERVLIHCRAGIGRTGTLSIIVLMLIGLSMDEARDATRSAGGCPENEEQWDLIRAIKDRLSRVGILSLCNQVSGFKY